MVEQATNRINKYSAKLDSDVIRSRVEALKDSMAQNIQHPVKRLVEIEERINMICGKNGVSSILKPSYMAAGRELYRLVRIHQGATLANEAIIALTKWVQRGLNPLFLMEIMSALKIEK